VLTAVVRGGRPPTVPQIARSLGHSRQAVQRLADALVALGMVDTIDNPDHKRARLLVPTRRGREAYEAADAVSRTWADEVAAGLDPADLAAATRTLREIRNRLEAGTAPR
jgi:DNA-binding MarR family transcriptional regulator